MCELSVSRRVAVTFALLVLVAVLLITSTAFAAVTRYEETDPSVVKTGTWTSSPLPGHSAGAVDYTSDGTPPVGSATFSFTGTGVDYIAAKWFNRGFAAVSLDGEPAQDVDLYAPGVSGDTSTVSYQQVVYSASGLADGPHTLTVTWTGRHNPAASGVANYLITIDAFDVTTPDPEPPVVSTPASSPWSLVLLALVGVVGAAGAASVKKRLTA